MKIGIQLRAAMKEDGIPVPGRFPGQLGIGNHRQSQQQAEGKSETLTKPAGKQFVNATNTSLFQHRSGWPLTIRSAARRMMPADSLQMGAPIRSSSIVAQKTQATARPRPVN